MALAKQIETNEGVRIGEDANPQIDSRFRLIVVAGLRTKQLLHGSLPRIEADLKRRRHTSIALEEVKRGLVPFTIGNGLKGL
jgi:DNA-directed RNA polymerase omega subunit